MMPEEKLAVLGGKPVWPKAMERHATVEQEEIDAVVEVLKSQKITQLSNNVVVEFENEFAAWLGRRHAVSVNSGTAALHVALAAMGIGPGVEVIIPPYTFIATATAVVHQNGVPVFTDIEPRYFNMDPDKIEAAITPQTRALVPVHLFGFPARIDEIMEIARKHNLLVLEDACQSHGAEYKGKKVGTLGHAACFSFQESKNMMTGEGGMIVTDDDELAKTCRIIRHIGMSKRYQYDLLGYNYRMPAMEAALGRVQLRKLDRFNKRRRQVAAMYAEGFKDLPVVLPVETHDVFAVFHLYVFLLNENLAGKKKRIFDALAAENVPAWWVYPEPLYMVPLFRNLIGYGKECPYNCPHHKNPVHYARGMCPVCESIAVKTIALPTDPCFSDEEIEAIIKGVRKVLVFYLNEV